MALYRHLKVPPLKSMHNLTFHIVRLIPSNLDSCLDTIWTDTKTAQSEYALSCESLVGVTRFELVTSSVSGKRSPPELNALVLFSDSYTTMTAPARQQQFSNFQIYEVLGCLSREKLRFSNVSSMKRSSKCRSMYSSNTFCGGTPSCRLPER